MKINPLTAIDFYKADHRRQYPDGTTEIYSNFTPRTSRIPSIKGVIFFGLQYFIKEFLIDTWNNGFFRQPKEEVVSAYKRRMDTSLGKDSVPIRHIEALHELGYLPVKIKALAEGTYVPIGVPCLTIVNTRPEFFWITNYLETVMSSYLWKPITSATMAYEYKKILTHYAAKTGCEESFVQFQAHDFSFRGMSGLQDAALSGAGHLTSFVGTDSVPAIDFLENYYRADCENELIGCSVPATEHSVMCAGGQENEIDTFKRLINELYPSGIISIVSDSWDYWKVITEYVPMLKNDILKRTGKVVLRPDSGDPVKIICGDPNAVIGAPEYKGSVECLWETFGGTITSTGHKLLDSHIGLIYGDSITLERAEEILRRLDEKGFCSGNIVFGIGSFTYQYQTRDTFGFAMKATSAVVNNERREIFKNPKTDNGTKKSAKGLLKIVHVNGKYILLDQQSEDEEKQGFLKEVFVDGKLLINDTLTNIRGRIND
jgi:nicotinamide phosphoribosyltransferase